MTNVRTAKNIETSAKKVLNAYMVKGSIKTKVVAETVIELKRRVNNHLELGYNLEKIEEESILQLESFSF